MHGSVSKMTDSRSGFILVCLERLISGTASITSLERPGIMFSSSLERQVSGIYVHLESGYCVVLFNVSPGGCVLFCTHVFQSESQSQERTSARCVSSDRCCVIVQRVCRHSVYCENPSVASRNLLSCSVSPHVHVFCSNVVQK